jgi:signal transduction histidine kinase
MTSTSPLQFKLWKYSAIFFGRESKVRLEHRIANAVFFITTISLLLAFIIVSIVLPPTPTVLIYPAAIIVQATLYYFSRFRGHYKICITLANVLGYFALWTAYFTRSGVSGPAFLGFVLLFQGTTAILPRRQHLLWTAINVISFMALLFIEYSRPELISQAYSQPSERFIDLAVTYCFSLTFLYIITRTHRDSYAREKHLAIERAEKLEQQKDMLTEANKGLLQFNNIVSHNLRAPVASIIGMSEVLRTPISDEEKEWAVNYMVEAAQMLDAVITDLNNILETNSAPEPEEIYFEELVASVIKSLHMQVQEASAEIQVSIHPGATSITAIRAYMHSILHNLVSNAIKYRDESRDTRIFISTAVKDNKFYLTVQDNGIGINLKKHSSELFGLYKRFNLEKEGRGLGLHMTRTQVESLGGSIRVDSELGAGSTFTVILPV